MNSNKIKAAPSKKERPRSSDKVKSRRRDGTPDKPSTPGPDDDVNIDTRPSVLNNEEIQNLAIKAEELSKIRQEVIETSRTISNKQPSLPKPVSVKKVMKDAVPKPPTKTVTIAKGAPPRAPLKPIETEGNTGPRFDPNGNVISHSILGTLEEYKNMAFKKGELEVDYYIREQDRVQTPTLKYAHTKKTKPSSENAGTSNALISWQKRMKERRQQQGYLSRLLEKPVEQLVMNQGDTYREKQELRYLIDRSIPAVDYGKGYRIGSEFWNQQMQIGDDDTGMHVTLTQTEQGYPPPIEHVKVPGLIQKEKGIDLNVPVNVITKPWRQSSFLRDRTNQLNPVMSDLDPCPPAMDDLVVQGTANPYIRYIRAATPVTDQSDANEVEDLNEDSPLDPLADYADVYSPPIFGPAVNFAGQTLQWTGDSNAFRGQVAVDARVSFEAYSGCRALSILQIINVGTTAIYYNWKMLPKSNPFDLINANIQRFYFDTSSGVILPGDTLKFPFVFKSEKAGIFTEQWEFQTRPVVAGGSALVVTLRGVALREDKFKKQRDQIEMNVHNNIIQRSVRKILDDIIESIKTPDRPRSPVDAYITKEEIFSRLNPQLHFKADVVNRLGELHKMITCPPTMGDADDVSIQDKKQTVKEWDGNLEAFKRVVLDLDEDDERKPAVLESINDAVAQLAFPIISPTQQNMYQHCYQALSSLMDSIAGNATYVRNVLGLPDREPEEAELGTQPSESQRINTLMPADAREVTKSPVPQNTQLTPPTQGSRNTGKATPKPTSKEAEKKPGGGKADKDVKKDSKVTTLSQKELMKKDRASPTKKTASGRGGITASSSNITADVDRTTPNETLQAGSPSGGQDLMLERKYKEKLTAQVYMDINEFILNLVDAFETILFNATNDLPTTV